MTHDQLFSGIVSLQKNSFIDYPGKVSAILFYTGCNLRCPFCHNASLADGTSEPTITPVEIVAYLLKRKKFLEGITISGGEPTLYGNLPELVNYLKTLGYAVKLDSNGLNPARLEQTSFDFLAMDLKTTPDRYESLLGAKGDVSINLLKSLEIVKSMGKNGEIRITCAPGIIDDSVIEQLLPLLEGVYAVRLQPFKYSDNLIDPTFFLNAPAITDVDLFRWKDQIGTVVKECSVRGK